MSCGIVLGEGNVLGNCPRGLKCLGGTCPRTIGLQNIIIVVALI